MGRSGARSSVMGNNQGCKVLEIEPSEIQEVQIVARGSFGTVIEASWQKKLVAVKYTLRNQDLFLREIQTMSRLDHPNVVKFYGARTSKPGMFLVMEFATQGSVAERIYGKSAQIYPDVQGVRWALECALGLAYLHGMKPNPIIHRDLKPANLLLFENDIVKIGDFGLAQYRVWTKLKPCRVGSLLYMSPEVRKRQKYTEKCDVYSWALVFWAILARRRPYRRHNDEKPDLPEEWSEKIRKLIEWAWDSKPNQRPSMGRVVEELEGVIQEGTVNRC